MYITQTYLGKCCFFQWSICKNEFYLLKSIKESHNLTKYWLQTQSIINVQCSLPKDSWDTVLFLSQNVRDEFTKQNIQPSAIPNQGSIHKSSAGWTNRQKCKCKVIFTYWDQISCSVGMDRSVHFQSVSILYVFVK